MTAHIENFTITYKNVPVPARFYEDLLSAELDQWRAGVDDALDFLTSSAAEEAVAAN